jgi:hypothetical protein
MLYGFHGQTTFLSAQLRGEEPPTIGTYQVVFGPSHSLFPIASLFLRDEI